jgi:integrase
MKKVPDTHHLVRRDSVWYYRRRVPKHLVEAFGKDVIQLSLKTPHKKQAIKKREVYDVEWSAQFEAAENALNGTAVTGAEPSATPARLLTEPLAIHLIREYVERTDQRRQISRQADPPTNREELEERTMNAEIELQALRDPADPNGAQWVSGVADRLLQESNAAIGGPSLPYPAFVSQVRRALIEITRREIAYLNDDHSRGYFDHRFDSSRPSPTTVGELAEQFLALKEEEGAALGVQRKSLDKVGANVALIREILGDTTLVRDLNWDACRRAVSMLAQVPKNRTKIYKAVSLEEAITLAKSQGNSGLSAISQDQYLATLKDMLDLAVNKELIRTNYAAKLRPLKQDDLSPGEKTIPFDADQLQTFFQSEFYHACASGGGAPYKNSTDKDWRFWLPLLCLFMGMRPREVCQLHVSDLQKTPKGTWFVEISETDDDDKSEPKFKKTTKTLNSKRQIPLHPELIAIGFVKFVNEQRQASPDDLRLFRDINYNQYNDPAHYALRRFRETFLPKAITMKPRQNFYSFRHTWRDAMRLIDAPPDTLKALGAWSQGTLVSDNYGTKAQPDHQVQFINKIAYEGLDLSHLHVKK